MGVPTTQAEGGPCMSELEGCLFFLQVLKHVFVDIL